MGQEFILSRVSNAEISKKSDIRALKPKILVVEDDAINQKAAAGLLSILGCEVDLVANGYDAITAYCNGYDLVFLDIGLPDLDGVSVCKRIRAQYSDLQTPIIAYTAHGEEVEPECRNAGVSDFMIKPLLLNELSDLLSVWIPGYKPR